MQPSSLETLLAALAEQPQRITTLMQILHRTEGGCCDTTVKAVLAMPPDQLRALMQHLGLKRADRASQACNAQRCRHNP